MIPRPYNLFALLIFISLHSISAQSTTIINISGNSNFDEGFYEQTIQANLSKKANEIKTILLKTLAQRGFYNSVIKQLSIDSTVTKDSVLVDLNLIEGEPTYIKNIIFDSLDVTDIELSDNQLNYLYDEIFIESELETKIESILNNYENSGYPFVNITIKSVYFYKDLDSVNVVDVFIKVDKELLRKFDKVEITGNTKTNDKVIINNARLTKGEIYSQEKIKKIPILLKKLNFFKSINIPNYYINSKDEGILQIAVEEKNTNMFDGIIGYVPATLNGESGYLTGFVNIGLRNLFGTGRSASIRWRQENTLTQELELKYLEPWLFDQPFNLNLQFFQRKQDSSYVRRIVGGSLEFLATENISASLILESESIIPSIEVANVQFSKSSSLNTGLEVKLDYRDDVFTPQSGLYFFSRYKYRSKNIENIDANISDPNKLNYHYYEFDFGIYYQTFQSQVLALGIHSKAIIGDQFDISDLFQFGGTNSVRGFRENQFIGKNIIWSNLEYRFLLSQESYVFTFYDAGYYETDSIISQNISKFSDFKNGYGLGISLSTTLGILRVSYAFAEGSSISNGLIHFGILNDF